MSGDPRILRFSPPRDEPQLTRKEKRAKGVYYTPPEIVRWIVARSLEVLAAAEPPGAPPRVLDPSCGAGAFLLEARAQIPGCSLYGVDLDPTAIAAARASFTLNPNLTLTLNLNPLPLRLDCADFLSSSFSPAPFDLILGNPPYINIRELAKSTSPAYRQELRQRFQSARGNFDLYVLFLERSLQLLKPGGVCGMIIPNKWAGLDYARPLRELLLAKTTLHDIVDLSGVSVFAEAEVYPQILVFQNAPPAKSHAVRVREVASAAQLHDGQPYRLMPQSQLSPRTISTQRTLDVESRVPVEPLGQRVRLHSGASGYTAGHMAELLQEAGEAESPDERFRPFIVSGNIDRYSIRLGNIRYMQRKLRQPLLDLNSDALSPLKKKLYANPKIVIAGMFRRIEAAYDDQGLALGVQVYAAAEPLDDPYYLLALLNSRLMSYLFRERFAAKKLAGGYLAMNKGQLEQLPIRIVEKTDDGDLARAARIAELARSNRLQRVHKSAEAGYYEVDREIDELVYQLYRLTAAEIHQVDAAFEERQAKAA